MIYFSPLKVHSSQVGDESFREGLMENKNFHARSSPWFGRFRAGMDHFLAERGQNQLKGNGATSILPCAVAGMDALGSGGLIRSLETPKAIPLPRHSAPVVPPWYGAPMVRWWRATGGDKLVAKATGGCPLQHGPRSRTTVALEKSWAASCKAGRWGRCGRA